MYSDAKTPCRSEKSDCCSIPLRPACVPGDEQPARVVGSVRALESARRRAGFAAARPLVQPIFSKGKGSIWHDGVALARTTGPTYEPINTTTHLEATSARQVVAQNQSKTPGGTSRIDNLKHASSDDDVCLSSLQGASASPARARPPTPPARPSRLPCALPSHSTPDNPRFS